MPIDLNDQQTRDALRLGLQSAVAAAATYFVLQMIGSEEAFVGVISAVLIVQPSIGSTTSAGWDRFIATIVGSLVGLSCLLLLPPGYGVMAALTIAMFVMNVVAGFRPGWRYGVVAAVALALAQEDGSFAIALDRAQAIGIGIVIAVGVSLSIWADSAASRARRHMSEAFAAAAKRFDVAMRFSDDEGAARAANAARHDFHQAFSNGREAAEAMRGKGSERMLATLDTIEQLYNSVVLIGRLDGDTAAFSEAEESLEALRQEGCAAIEALGVDSAELDKPLTRFRDALSAAEAKADDKSAGADGGQAVASLLFSLKDIATCIETIADGMSDGESGLISTAREAVPKDVVEALHRAD